MSDKRKDEHTLADPNHEGHVVIEVAEEERAAINGGQYVSVAREKVPKELLAEIDAMTVGAAFPEDFFQRLDIAWTIDQLIAEGYWEESPDDPELIRPTQKGFDRYQSR